MNIFYIAGATALAGFIVGLLLGVAVGGGARADQEFQEYVDKKNSDL